MGTAKSARPPARNSGRSNRAKKLLTVAAAFAAGWAGQRVCSASPDTWLGTTSTDWGTNSNWSLDQFPGSGDDAIDNAGLDIDFNTNDSVNSLTTNGTFNLYGGGLGGSQASDASVFQFNNVLTFDGGGISTATIQSNPSGSVVIDSNGSNFLSNVVVNSAVVVGNGYIQLYGPVNASNTWTLNGGQIQLHDGNADFALSSTGEIQGTGTINENFGGSTLNNGGLVVANVAGQTLSLNNSIITGAGTYEAINGATLSIGGNLSGSNTIVHGDTGTVLINGGEVSGTISAATGTGITFAGNGNDSMQAANITGNLTFPSGAYVQEYGDSTITGTVAMSTTSNGIQLHDGNAKITLTVATLLHGYGAIYENFGGSVLENDGAISADVSGQTIYLNNSNITGSGMLEAQNGGVVSIGGQLNPSGMTIQLDANPASTVEINGGGLAGSLGTSSGTGLSFTGNGNNYTSAASVAATLTFPQGGYAQVYGSTTINGNIVMATNSNGIQLHDGNALLLLNPGALMHGFGTVYENFGGSTVENNGTISGDVSGQTLALNNSNITGDGVFQGINGGAVSIGGFLNASSATVHADTGAVIVNGGGIGGTFSAATGSGISFSNNGNNYMSNAVVQGNLTFFGAGYTQVYGGGNQVGGTVTMSDVANGIQLHDGNAVLTIEPTGVLQGYGTVYQNFGGATFTNNGAVSANVPAQVLTLEPTNITGNGAYNASNGGVVSIGGELIASNSQVNVDSNPNSAVEINGGGLAGTLGATTGTGLSFTSNGGNYTSAATVNGTLTFPNGGYAQMYGVNTINGTINFASNSNGIQLHDGNASLNISPSGALQGYGAIYQNFGGATVNNSGLISSNTPGQTLLFFNDFFNTAGTIQIAPGAILQITGTPTQTGGVTTINGTLQSNQTYSLTGGVVNGGGTLEANLDQTGGTLNPGDAPGILAIVGNYTQASGGELSIELGGYNVGTQFSQLDVSGSASLAGSLDVTLVNGFVPQIGDKFDVLLSGGDAGSFSSTISSSYGLTYSVNYQPTFAQIEILTVPEPATAALFLAATAGMLARRSRRRSVK